MIAAVLKLPVSLAFGLYRGGNRYDLVFETFEDQGLDLPRAQRATRMAALIQCYAARLEHHARQAPYNWFYFYELLNAHEQPQPAPEEAADDSVDAYSASRRAGLGGAAGHCTRRANRHRLNWGQRLVRHEC